MNLVLSVALVCVTVIWLTERFGAVIRWRYGPREDAPLDPMPADLIAHAEAYPEIWAQNDVIRAMNESYKLLGNWDAVRTRFLPLTGA